jgi:hypothetical protein
VTPAELDAARAAGVREHIESEIEAQIEAQIEAENPGSAGGAGR